jgi:RNA polymerase sigma factor for flagellar operon FliA
MIAQKAYSNTIGIEDTVKDMLPFIKYNAFRLMNRLPPLLTVDDLISVGIMGLLDAMRSFDSTKASLKTFAEFRIKGAMLDELRNFDEVPRSLKKKVKAIKQAYAKLEAEKGSSPEDEEVAEAAGITLDEYYKTLQGSYGAITLRFEDFGANLPDGESMNIEDTIPDTKAVDPLASVVENSRRKILAKLIDELPKKEKLVLSLYYWEGLTMKEIGLVLDITEGRVCQLHSKAVIKLKIKLGDDRL